MSNDATAVRLAPLGSVYLGPVGTTLPTNATGALNAALKAVGYVSEEGVSVTPKVGLADIMAWQSTAPVKQALDTVEMTVKFNMIEVNVTTWGLYFMNETFTNNFGEGAIAVASRPPSQEVALVVEWIDDDGDQTRLVVPRASLADRDALVLNRKKEQATGITLKCLDSSGNFYYVYTENPDLIPAT